MNEQQILEDYDNWLRQYHAKNDINNQRILKAIKAVKGQEYHDYLVEMLEENEQQGEMEITHHPEGKYQDENDYGPIKGCWVDQHINGGYTGDEYAGYVYVELKPGKYLKYYYAM